MVAAKLITAGAILGLERPQKRQVVSRKLRLEVRELLFSYFRIFSRAKHRHKAASMQRDRHHRHIAANHSDGSRRDSKK